MSDQVPIGIDVADGHVLTVSATWVRCPRPGCSICDMVEQAIRDWRELQEIVRLWQDEDTQPPVEETGFEVAG